MKKFTGKKELFRAAGILLCTFILAGGLYVVDKKAARLPDGGKLKRNDYGGGARTEELYVWVGGEKEEVQVEVPPRLYRKDELNALWEKVCERLDEYLPGENASTDEVKLDLRLPREVPGFPVSAEWSLSRYDVIDLQGKILETYADDRGTEVIITGVLKCQGEESVYEKRVTVYPKVKEDAGSISGKAKEAVEASNQETETEKYLSLPGEIDGKKALWERKQPERAATVLVGGCLAAVMSVLLKVQEEEKSRKARERQMMLDYPDVLHQFTLLIGAGMTVKAAWGMITANERQSDRFVFEEMRVTYQEMKSGIPEQECYERFGNRCGTAVYLKFGAMLSQNLKKGTKGMDMLLRTEAAIAFEERKRNAKQQGEEAGTKLLMPMFLMLGIVLLMVVVPAFFSINI